MPMKACLILVWSALLAVNALDAATLPEAQRIDAILASDWQKHGLQPNPPASDEVIVRRLYLDIAGRVPTLQETQEFMRSGDAVKRMKLIDHLLAGEGYTSNMFNYWADLLRLTDDVAGKVPAQAYAEYVKQCLRENKTYDRFVYDLISAEGNVWDNNAIGFYTRDENKLDHLAYAVQVFLGTSIICAECHNHPFDKWSQMDFYGLAAFTYGMGGTGRKSSSDPFGLGKSSGKGPQLLDKMQLSKLNREERQKYLEEHAAEIEKQQRDRDLVQKTLSGLTKNLLFTTITMTDKLPQLPPDYKYHDGEPGQTINPKTLFGHDAKLGSDGSRLGAFAKWMTSPDNPRFTTVIANRMWKKVFGLGLIEPVDEITDSTVPSNPELMDYLSQLMVAKRYSLKSFLRVLYNTDAYQRAVSTTEVAPGETYYFTGPLLRRMSAEQVWDSTVTLVHGDLDRTISEENERLHQFLTGLKRLVDAVHAKGMDGMLEIAQRAGELNNGKQKENAKMKMGGDDVLVALLGEEGARAIQRGYGNNSKKPGAKTPLPMLDKNALGKMSKSERQAALEMAANVTLSTRASELPSPEKPGHLLRIFGQSDREVISNANDEASVGQALALLNSPLSEILNNPVSKLQQDLAGVSSASEKIDLLYVSLLSRRPSRSERAVLDEVMASRGDKALADVTRALLTSSQFVFVQ